MLMQQPIPSSTQDPSATTSEQPDGRRNWLAVLARASREELEEALQSHAPKLRFEHLRRAECGMVMLRGRMGGTGDAFNLGEATVTRCTVRLADGQVGCGHVLGRDTRRAELVAVFDALMQESAYHLRLQKYVLEPLRARQLAARAAAAQAAAGSRVEFLTLVRGAA
jgi:alpha-D-ribose 1-methylphosphonate 5-triphosphate synthase subunit PhnG